MVIYKICSNCEAHVDACHEVCPYCGSTLVSIEDD